MRLQFVEDEHYDPLGSGNYGQILDSGGNRRIVARRHGAYDD